MEALRQRVVDLAFALAWTVVRRLPERTVTWLFQRAADRTYRGNGRGVQRLRSNLAVVRPDATPAELDALTQAGMRSYLRYWQEAFRLPDWTDEQIVGRVRTVNEKLLRDAHAAGRASSAGSRTWRTTTTRAPGPGAQGCRSGRWRSG